MRFKVKLPNSSKYLFVTVDSISPTVGTLKKVTADAFETLGIVGVDFEISLNGKDVISGSDRTLTDVGIVSGDVIRIITKEEFNEKFREAGEISNLDSSSSSESMSSQAHEKGLQDSMNMNAQTSLNAQAVMSNNSILPLQSLTIDGEQPIDSVVVNRCLREPILCRESTSTEIPESLKTTYVLSDVKSAVDAMAVVLHVMMLEAGYVQKIKSESNFNLLEETKIGHIYRIHYIHPSCPNATVILTFIPVGSVIAVNGSYQCSTFHLNLKPSQFVCTSLLNSPNVAMVYNNLSRLSHLFKDAVVYPLLTSLQTGEGIPSSCGITSLSTEVKMIILSFLTVEALLNLSASCKEFYELANQQSIWKKLCFTDFPESISERFFQDQSLTWKEKYQYLYKKRKQRGISVGSYFGPPRYAIPFPGLYLGPTRGDPYLPILPPPGALPGMIGGEYDRIPTVTGLPNDGGPHPFMPPPGPRHLPGQQRLPFYRPLVPRWLGYFSGYR